MRSSTLRDLLQDIYDEYGRLDPDLVCEVAAPADHPLHSHLEWDDSIAGRDWRRRQAHELIRSARVVYKTLPDGTDRSVRAFHALRTEDGYRYEPADKVAADPLSARILMADMEREWKALRRRFDEFAEFWHMVVGDAREADKAA